MELTIQEKTEDFKAEKETILLDDTTILHAGGDKKLMDEKLKYENLAAKDPRLIERKKLLFY